MIGLIAPPEVLIAPEFMASKLALKAPGAGTHSIVRAKLAIPDHYKVLVVVALGKPKETVEIEPLGPGGDIKYWRDADGVHHVPKRALEDLIVPIG